MASLFDAFLDLLSQGDEQVIILLNILFSLVNRVLLRIDFLLNLFGLISDITLYVYPDLKQLVIVDVIFLFLSIRSIFLVVLTFCSCSLFSLVLASLCHLNQAPYEFLTDRFLQVSFDLDLTQIDLLLFYRGLQVCKRLFALLWDAEDTVFDEASFETGT